MQIVVCLKEVIDTKINLSYGQVSENLFQKSLTCRVNPADIRALAEAIKLKKEHSGVTITLVCLGPPRVESYLREGLALGADQAVRIWQEGWEELSSFTKARLLSGALSRLGADLILVGSRSLDNASGLVGPLIGGWLEIPCIGETVGFQLEDRQNRVSVTRKFSKGTLETIRARLPLVLAIAGSPEKLPYASLDKLLESQEAEIEHLTLADLGISPREVQQSPIRLIGTSLPRPRPRIVPYNSSLPAFYRILALLQGGISKRRGEILQGDTEELVDQLFDLLLKS